MEPAAVHLRPSRESLLAELSAKLFDSTASEREAIRLLQAGMLRVALERSNGNVTKAAALLGRHRNDIQRRLVLFGMHDVVREIREDAKERGRQMKLWNKKIPAADGFHSVRESLAGPKDFPRAIHSLRSAPKLCVTSLQPTRRTGT